MYNRKSFGYTNGENVNLIIEPSEAQIVKLIFHLYLDGYSVVGICKELNNRNILSHTGNPNWAKITIEKILNNEKYTGYVLYFKTYTQNYSSVRNIGQHDQMICEKHHEPIISHEIFEQLKLKNNAALTLTLQTMALLEVQLNIVLRIKRAISPFFIYHTYE